MRQRGDRFRLLLEVAKRFWIVQDPLGDDLDGHLAAKPCVARPVDLAHSTGAERGKDLVRTKPIAGGQAGAAIRLRSGVAQIVVLWLAILSLVGGIRSGRSTRIGKANHATDAAEANRDSVAHFSSALLSSGGADRDRTDDLLSGIQSAWIRLPGCRM